MCWYHQALLARTGHRAMVVASLRPSHDPAQIERRSVLALGGPAGEAEAERRFKAVYPSLHAHMKAWDSFVDPETGKKRGLRYREDQGRYWWELRPCAYYDAFDNPKVLYVDITWSPSFSRDTTGRLTSN